MAYITNETTGICISHFVSLEVKQEVIRTTQQLLDGSVYIQRIGEPTVSYAVSAYSCTLAATQVGPVPI